MAKLSISAVVLGFKESGKTTLINALKQQKTPETSGIQYEFDEWSIGAYFDEEIVKNKDVLIYVLNGAPGETVLEATPTRGATTVRGTLELATDEINEDLEMWEKYYRSKKKKPLVLFVMNHYGEGSNNKTTAFLARQVEKIYMPAANNHHFETAFVRFSADPLSSFNQSSLMMIFDILEKYCHQGHSLKPKMKSKGEAYIRGTPEYFLRKLRDLHYDIVEEIGTWRPNQERKIVKRDFLYSLLQHEAADENTRATLNSLRPLTFEDLMKSIQESLATRSQGEAKTIRAGMSSRLNSLLKGIEARADNTKQTLEVKRQAEEKAAKIKQDLMFIQMPYLPSKDDNALLTEIEQYRIQLLKEYYSSWPYPNKDLKKKKADFLRELVTKHQAALKKYYERKKALAEGLASPLPKVASTKFPSGEAIPSLHNAYTQLYADYYMKKDDLLQIERGFRSKTRSLLKAVQSTRSLKV